jgi:hypothetical protein
MCSTVTNEHQCPIPDAVQSKRGLLVAPESPTAGFLGLPNLDPGARPDGHPVPAPSSVGPARQALPSPGFGSDRLRIWRGRSGLAGVLGPAIKLFEMLLEGRGQA